MVNPCLWGPSVWQTMFACAWNCNDKEFLTLKKLLIDQIPLLIPCVKCRNHFARNRLKVNRRARGEPKTPMHAFQWLWYLKDEVNKSLSVRSTPMEDIVERHKFHGGIVDDIALGDSLVLMAMEAHEMDRADVFVELCQALVVLLPLPDDSELKLSLRTITVRGILPGALRAAKAARVERGVKTLSRDHYEEGFLA